MNNTTTRETTITTTTTTTTATATADRIGRIDRRTATALWVRSRR
jgi:hypothetical protein